MSTLRRGIRTGVLAIAAVAAVREGTAQRVAATAPAGSVAAPVATPPERAVIGQYCANCHSTKAKMGGVVLEGLDPAHAGENAGTWERVLRKMRSSQMPPPGMPRPDAKTSSEFIGRLEQTLDRAALANPYPGAPMPHRLNRTEYSNAVRDLLALDTQPGLALPVDESGSGFDNMADLLSMSPALFERYLSTARHVSRLAVGDLKTEVSQEIFDNRPSSGHITDPDEMPFHSRGGLSVRYYFPVDAEYQFRVNASGAPGGGGPEGKAPRYEIRVPVKAGLHTVVATFMKEYARPEVATPATGRRPGGGAAAGAGNPPESPALLDLRVDGSRLKLFEVPQRGTAPNVTSVTIGGPYKTTGRGNTPSRAKIFVCHPQSAKDETPCAQTILTTLARQAFRRKPVDSDIVPLLRFYSARRSAGGDFDDGIQDAIEAMLVSPDFLFRVERAPKDLAPGSVYRLNGYDLASRLSFFLWSSIPDEALLRAAEQGELNKPAGYKAQFRRMLADPKSQEFAKNFGGQWLYLRTLERSRPDADLFPRFDESLRQAYHKETELFFTKVFRENRSVLDLLDADYTFLNDRLAVQYGIHNVYGSQFRETKLTDANRGGIIGQGAVLTVTSYPNRTSVVQRGKWVLENLLGMAPPPPPPDIPDLQAKSTDGHKLTMREAMEKHRANATCASCHSRMDPIGFSLENYDGIGTWRSEDSGMKIDSTGKLPDGTPIAGPAGLKKLLCSTYRDQFIETFTEKLLTYALGRSVEAPDRPTVRMIARKAADDNYRFSAFIEGIVESTPFQYRRKPDR